jgi:hypothetical protein
MPAAATAASILDTPFDFYVLGLKYHVHCIGADQIQPFVKLIARADELIE